MTENNGYLRPLRETGTMAKPRFAYLDLDRKKKVSWNPLKNGFDSRDSPSDSPLTGPTESP